MCAPLMARAWLTHMLQANRQRPSISNTACTRPDQGGRLGQGAPCVDGAWVARAHPLHSPRGQCRRMRRPPPQAAPSACAHIYRPWRLLSRGLEGARRHLDGPGRGPGSAWRRARLSVSLATACLASCGSGRGSMWRALAWGTRRAAVRRPRPCLTLTACSSVCLHQLFAALAVLTAGPQRTRPLCLAAPVCLDVCEAHQPAVDGSSSCISLVVEA